ncbi:hypothetical protein WEI85_23105 [Actinomycetes bacterium KLBMP 9797]
MAEPTATRRQFGDGPLSQAAAWVYTLLVVELLLVLVAGPGLVPLVLLDRDASNAPLAALCAVPLGPAVAAAAYALHHRRGDLTDLRPAAAFWRGYRSSLRGALLVWVPYLAWLTVIAIGLANFRATGLPGWWAVLLVLIALAATLWCANALMVTALFAFRAVDVARLALYFLVRRPGVTIGNAGLLAVAAGVTALGSEAVLALLGSLLIFLYVLACRPMTAEIQEEFTA